MGMSNEFGQLLRFYRRQGHDPQRGGQLTQERLGELLGAQIGLSGGYSGAAVSDWERSKSRIDKDDRLVLLALVRLLHECGGIRTLTEANTFLQAGNYRPLDATEASEIFRDEEKGGNGAPQAEPEPRMERHWKLLILLLVEEFLRPEPALSATSRQDGGPPHWSDGLLALLGRFFAPWSSEGVLRALAWLAIWLLAWGLTFPFLHWPFADQAQALALALTYAIGSLLVPALVGLIRATRNVPFWQEQNLANSPALRFYTHLGTSTGFHLGYGMVFLLGLGGLLSEPVAFSILDHGAADGLACSAGFRRRMGDPLQPVARLWGGERQRRRHLRRIFPVRAVLGSLFLLLPLAAACPTLRFGYDFCYGRPTGNLADLEQAPRPDDHPGLGLGAGLCPSRPGAYLAARRLALPDVVDRRDDGDPDRSPGAPAFACHLLGVGGAVPGTAPAAWAAAPQPMTRTGRCCTDPGRVAVQGAALSLAAGWRLGSAWRSRAVSLAGAEWAAGDTPGNGTVWGSADRICGV